MKTIRENIKELHELKKNYNPSLIIKDCPIYAKISKLREIIDEQYKNGER